MAVEKREGESSSATKEKNTKNYDQIISSAEPPDRINVVSQLLPSPKRGCNAWWIQRRSYIKASHEDLKHDFLRISEALVALTFLPVLSPSTAVNRNEPNVSPLQLLPPMPVEQ